MQSVTSPLSRRHMFDDSPSYKRKLVSPACMAGDLTAAAVHIETPTLPTPRRSLFTAKTPAFLNLPPPNDSSTPCGVPMKKSMSMMEPMSPLSAGSDGSTTFGSSTSSNTSSNTSTSSIQMHRLRKNNRSTSSLRLTSAGVSFDPIDEEGSLRKPFRFSLELDSPANTRFTHSMNEADSSMDTDEDGLGSLSQNFRLGGSTSHSNTHSLNFNGFTLGGAADESAGAVAAADVTADDINDTPSARPVRPSLNPLCKRSYNSSSTPFAAKFKRPRRTHSMFQDPKELMQEELDEEKEMVRRLSLSPDVNNNVDSFLVSADCTLESFSVEGDPFRRIKRETLVQILDGHYSHYYDRHVVIDCRFEYEYDGGHIDGAININSKDRLEELLSNEEGILGNNCNNMMRPGKRGGDSRKRTLLIFHCEYSAHRGPRMAMHLRNRDRRLNMTNYPHLNFPDVVILQGGYNHFFEQFHTRCYPPQYVEMNDSMHKSTCEREMGRFRRHMKLRSESSINKQQGVICSPVGLSRSLSENVDYHRPKRVVSCQLWR
ncbi:YALI0C06460p [Yarrowia lipolytica CLIB122]|uniref:M-phase inducer phosphatase n=2 Tax=Yarrowia lipolytica TaxID=4952 RepID=Q6CCU4_YARLI|eukprot:XP_501518.2 YALI0C06460p [Yarrowia lipolytica CLIB122]